MRSNVVFIRFLSGKIMLTSLILLSLLGSGCGVQSSANTQKKSAIRTLIVGGGSSHDFDKWYKEVDVATLEKDGFASVKYTSNVSEVLAQLANLDVLILANNQPMEDPALRKAIFAFVAEGKGLIIAHAGLWYNWKDWPEYNQQLAGGGSNSHDKYGPFDVTVVDTKHPVTKGVPEKFNLSDERYYYKPDPSGPGIKVLASSSAQGSEVIYPSVFVVNNSKARIVGIALGHDAASHDLPAYQILLRNAVKWVSRK
ncbi:type 1 glutamine amidotransferase [Pedobacter sp. UYP30]|uniref:ThuA domain-containing protein n=1 Tax=Pedobacter sp. UYP30 TaxID=1756400 RepID=UPI00339436D9